MCIIDIKGNYMSDMFTKILPKLLKTKNGGVYYKEVQHTTIQDNGATKIKIVDKVFIIRYRDNGKARFITLGKHSEGIREAYCKAKRNEYMTLAKNDELPPQIEKRLRKTQTTLNDLATVYFKEKSTENKTNKQQQGKYNLHVKPDIGTKPIEHINKEDIKTFRQKLIDMGKAAKTVNGVIQLITAIINHSIKEHNLKIVNPTTGIGRLKVDDARERFLSINDVQELLEAIKDNELLYRFTRMALSTGARLEGVLNIQKKDIDTQHNKVTIKDLKSDSTYSGFFDDTMKGEVIQSISSMKANDYYVGGRTTPYPGRSIRRNLKPILDELFNKGLDVHDTKNRVVIHTLRHTFASQLAIKGIPIFTIQTLMNHAKIEMTMRYAKLAPDSGLNAIKGLYDEQYTQTA